MKKALSVIMVALGLSACGGAGSNYTGQWVSTLNDCYTLDVAVKGSDYIVKIDVFGLGGIQKVSTTGAIKNDVLQVEMGKKSVPFQFEKSTGTLLSEGRVYKRDNGESKDCKAKTLANE